MARRKPDTTPSSSRVPPKRGAAKASPSRAKPAAAGPSAPVSPPERRKGARRRSEVPDDVREGLNSGRLATANLVEFLVLDQLELAQAVAKSLGRAARRAITPEMGATVRMRTIGLLAAEEFGVDGLGELAAHPSDTVRGWAAYALAALPDLTLEERLGRARPLADDPHFGVREWAWLALRPCIAADLDQALDLLEPWVHEPAVGIRRFAVEITRPRGVWCAHLESLKRSPAPGLPLLDPLSGEPEKYVQDSVANWLNDASKSAPDWVRGVCRKWSRKNDSAATRRICQRALRTIGP